MTNEEAYSWITQPGIQATLFRFDRQTNEALKMAIEALGEQDKALHEFCTDCKEYDQEHHCCPRFNRVILETLKEVQSKEPGHWLIVTGERHMRWRKCPECGSAYDVMYKHNFCPSCGADLRGADIYVKN